jgi:hypothetical protein
MQEGTILLNTLRLGRFEIVPLLLTKEQRRKYVSYFICLASFVLCYLSFSDALQVFYKFKMFVQTTRHLQRV